MYYNYGFQNKILKGKKFSSLSEFKDLKTFPNAKPLVLINLELKIEYANRPFVKTFNLKEGDLLSELRSEPSIEIILNNVINKRFTSFHFDLYGVKNSEGYFTEIERVIIGEKNFFVVSFSSLAERKKIEEKINNLHYALEYGFLPVMTLNKKGEITYSTDTFEKIFGKKFQEIYGKKVVDFLTPYLSQKAKEEFEKAVKRKTEWKSVVAFENKLTNSSVYYELVLRPIAHPHNRISGFVLAANDINDHILRLRTIEQTEKRQRMILNTISEPLMIVRKERDNFIFENANEIFFEIFGVKQSEVVEKEFLNFPNEKLADTILTAFDRVLFENRSMLKIKISDEFSGKDFICKISSFDCEPESSKIFVVSFFDITQQLENEKRLQRAYEKEMRLNKLKTTFLANMSHEIRTPLNAVIGYADLLDYELRELENENLVELSTYLKDGAKRLVKLVENITDISRIDSGEYEVSYSMVDVLEILEKIKNQLSEQLESKKIKLCYDLDKNLGAIETDANVFEKIFREILDNAIKYNVENGAIVVRSYFLHEAIRFEITDTGHGISKEMLHEVIQPFMQDDLEGYKRRFEGAGLGLTLAHKATKLLGGTLYIESEEGKGTKIVITLPNKKSENEK